VLGKFFKNLNKIDEILVETNEKVNNEMHQETCRECERWMRKTGINGWCREFHCWVLETTTNCEKFKKRRG